MKNLKNMNVGDIVTDDYRAAEVFKKYGIDYCCGGNQSLEQAASEKKLDIAELELKLSHLDEIETNRQLNYKDWNPGFLCDYIVNEFHNKVYRVLPELTAYLDKIVRVHGSNHPELKEIAKLFALINTELPFISIRKRTSSSRPSRLFRVKMPRMRNESSTPNIRK